MSLSKARLKYLRSLHLKKVRVREGVALVEGLNVVREAIRTGYAEEVLLTPEARARLGDVDAVPIGDIEAASLAQTRSPAGAFALVRDPCGPLDTAALGEAALLLLAAGVADPGNLGTLIRSAAALGFDGVVTTAGSVEAANAKVVRASAGAVFHLPVRCGEASDLIEAGFSIWAADAAGIAPSALPAIPARCALAVGNEPRGLPDSIAEFAALRVGVPMRAGVESLNVAVAAGILMHAIAGRR